MALTDYGNGNMVMPVSPMMGNGYGSNGFGFCDGSFWIIILFLFGMMNGGWGNGFFGGNGGAMPYMMNQNTNADVQRGFDQQAVMSGLNGIQASVTSGFGDVQNSLCAGFAGVNAAVNNGFAQAEIGANSRQMANMNQMFGLQTGLSNQMNTIAMNQQQNSCDNRAAVADLKYTVATEACADRAAVEGALRDVTANNVANTNAILNTMNAGIQSIKDQLCQDKIDAKNDTIAQLRQQIAMKDLQASQSAQDLRFGNTVQNAQNNLINELRSCPIPSQPVYGSQPIFTCGQNQNFGGCGCGM